MRYFANGASHELIHPKVDPFWDLPRESGVAGGLTGL